MRSRIALLSLLFASTLQAQIILGPESFVCQPRFSAPDVRGAAVATNGRETLVVVQTATGALYLQRLGDGAQPLTEHGVPIVREAGGFGIASDGDGFVIVWSANRTARSLHVGSGGVVSPPQVIGGQFRPSQIASNGNGYLVAWTDDVWTDDYRHSAKAMAMRLDGTGNPIGDPFPLTGGRPEANVLALASDGHDYLAAIDHFNPPDPKTTLVPVTGAGVAGPNVDLLYRFDALVHTANGYVGLWHGDQYQRAYAVPVDPSGHTGRPALIDTNTFSSASSNGSDILSVTSPYHRGSTATRIRRNGDAIEFIDVTGLMTQPDAYPHPGVLHTGDYFTITLSGPVGVALVPAPERPLFTFPTRQEAPAISGNVVAWREGSLLRAARAGVDATGLNIAACLPDTLYVMPLVSTSFASPFPPAYVVANDGQRTLIAWTEFRPGLYGTPTPLALKARMLAADGTLSPPFTIADNGWLVPDMISALAAIAAPNGFLVAWQQLGVSHIAKIDAGGNERGRTTLVLASDFALAPRRDGVLVLYRVQSGTLAAAPLHADLTAAGAPQVLAAKTAAPDLATDGNGHFLAVFTKDKQLWSQALDESGVPAGSAQLLGPGTCAHVSWNGSIFAVVSDANMALVAADGRVLMPLMLALPAGTQTVISGDTVATLHSAIDTGLGDENVVFVRRFSLTPPRHRATRP